MTSKLTFITGKGGVGKTLLASYLSQASSQNQQSVLLVESNNSQNAIPSFFSAKIDDRHRIVNLTKNLDYINLDPKQCLRDFFYLKHNLPHIYDLLFSRSKFKNLIYSIPGVLDVALLAWLHFVAENKLHDKKYGKIYFDCDSTGHFVKLISTPKGILEAPISNLLKKEIKLLDEDLRDGSKYSVDVVTLPEPLVLEETIELIDIIVEGHKMNLENIIQNRTYPQSFLSSSLPESIRSYLLGKFIQQNEFETSLHDHCIKKLKIDISNIYVKVLEFGSFESLSKLVIKKESDA